MKLLKVLALLSAAVSLCAQTPSTVNVVTPTPCLTSIDLTAMASGTLTVFAPGQNGAAAPFTSATGLVQAGTATRQISGGRIVGSLVLPNPAVTSPTNVGYTFTITSGSTKTTYASVFISPDGSGNWNLCNLQAGNYQTAFPTAFTGSSFQGGSVPLATNFGSTVTLHADPTANLQAATKQYVDSHSGQFTGGNVPNATSFGSTVGLAADPTTALQAATKQYVDNNMGIHTANGKSGSSITLAAPDVGAAVAADAGSPYSTVANGLLANNHFFFTDGTNGWCAAPFYCGLPPNSGPVQYQMYGSDTILTMLAFPGHFNSSDFLNLVNKFVGAKNTNSGATYPLGDFPEVVEQNGAAGQFCSGADQYCRYATGDGRIAVPLALYLYWQRTGDLTPYTANVAAIKTALAIPPRNGSNHLVTIVAGQEDIPGIGYLEAMRPLGDVADASVWYAWADRAMALMAAAAGDSTNATYFTNDFNNLTAGLASSLTDGSSHMLLFANGTQMNVIDIVDSTLAIYPLLGASPGTLLSGAQATQISTWLNSNYSSLVNSNGYVKMVNSCDVVGIIPSTGGAPYGSFTSPTTYQCGYWSTFGGYFAYALGLTNTTQASTYLSTWLGGQLLTTEYYNIGNTTPQGQNLLMTTAQSMRTASELFPATPQVATVVCLADSYGRCIPAAPPNSFAPGSTGVTIPWLLYESSTAALSGFNTIGTKLFPNATNGTILAQGLGHDGSTNDEAFFHFTYAGPGSASNHGGFDLYGLNDILSWWNDSHGPHVCLGVCTAAPLQSGKAAEDFGASQYVGLGAAPGLSFSTGSGVLNAGSTNSSGAILINSTSGGAGAGTVDFTLTWTTNTGGAYSYPGSSNCSFSVASRNSDLAKMVLGATDHAEGWATLSGAGEYITYLCAGN